MQCRTFSRFLPGALALAVMALPLSLSAQQIYRWKDANGKTHFTHTPPPNEQMLQKTLTPPSVPDAPSPAPTNAAPAEMDYASGGGGSEVPPASAQPQQVNVAECQEARKQLKLLASGADVAHMGSDGKPVPLEGAARAQEMQRLREFVLKSCEQ